MRTLPRSPFILALAFFPFLWSQPGIAQDFVGMGDSLGEGVQSGDASTVTQSASYLNWVAAKIGVSFPLPLIQTGPFGFVGEMHQRSRLDPSLEGANLAISGADIDDILNTRADAATVAEIDSETDLILFPRQGSQIEIVENINPRLVVCWIGGNDVLGSVLTFDQLDVSQMTPVAEFQARFLELAGRLDALDSALVLLDVPDVTGIGYLVDQQDLLRFTGSDFGLPDGVFTTLPTMFLIMLGTLEESVLQNPNFVLDAAELARVNERVAAFNAIIHQTAANLRAPVVPINALFRLLRANPPVIGGAPLTQKFLGGMLSLDGVHPSSLGQAFIADQTIAAINAFYGTSIPRLTPQELIRSILLEPHWDKDMDNQAVGRPFVGLVETLTLLLGFTGDRDDRLGGGAGTVGPRRLSEAERLALHQRFGIRFEAGDREQAITLLRKAWR